MIVLNFSHPLTPGQTASLARLSSADEVREIRVLTVCDETTAFAPQAAGLADACGLSPSDWQTLPIVIVPPALSSIAVTLLAELSGRMGHFPPCVRVRPVRDSLPTAYEVAEIVSLDSVRRAARGRR